MGQQNLNEYFTDLLQKVDLQIQDFEDNNNDPFSLCKQVIDYLQEIVGELKTFLLFHQQGGRNLFLQGTKARDSE